MGYTLAAPKPDDVATDGVIRRQMSWEQYLELPTAPRAEWVDGEAIIMMAPARREHIDMAQKLEMLFYHELANVKIYREAGYHINDSARVPDLLVVEPDQDNDPVWITSKPLIIVEILSPSTRAIDLFEKSDEYLSGGVEQYWIVDPAGWLIVRANTANGWQLLAAIDSENREAQVPLGSHGNIALSYDTIFGSSAGK